MSRDTRETYYAGVLPTSAAPPVSAIGQGGTYFDTTAGALMVSLDGSPWAAVSAGGGPAAWINVGPVVSLADPGDDVGIGTATPASKLEIIDIPAAGLGTVRAVASGQENLSAALVAERRGRSAPMGAGDVALAMVATIEGDPMDHPFSTLVGLGFAKPSLSGSPAGTAAFSLQGDLANQWNFFAVTADNPLRMGSNQMTAGIPCPIEISAGSGPGIADPGNPISLSTGSGNVGGGNVEIDLGDSTTGPAGSLVVNLGADAADMQNGYVEIIPGSPNGQALVIRNPTGGGFGDLFRIDDRSGQGAPGLSWRSATDSLTLWSPFPLAMDDDSYAVAFLHRNGGAFAEDRVRGFSDGALGIGGVELLSADGPSYLKASTSLWQYDGNTGDTWIADESGVEVIGFGTGATLGFYPGAVPVAQQTITGNNITNALVSLINALAALGLIVDGTTLPPT